MPKVDHLSQLLQAVATHDWNAARAVGLIIVAEEEKRGHHAAAQHLRGAMNPNGQVQAERTAGSNGTSLGDVGVLSAALTRVDNAVSLSDVMLRPAKRRELLALVSEWHHRDLLTARGVPRRRKLLFFGPPGCGKSMTAGALGNALSLPTYVVRLDAVVGAFLGQTALRIRELFRFAETTACVLLLDEIDALAKKRGSPRDVGELDRVVISLMQELEHALPRGLVVATSNVPEHLDAALFRRFDDVIEFPRPSRAELARFATARAATRKVLRSSQGRQLVVGATSYAEATRRIAAEERAIVLREVAK